MATKANKTSATETKAAVKTTAAETKKAVATTETKKAETKATEKTEAKKPAAKKTTTTKKTTKTVEAKVTYMLQYGGKEVNTSDVLDTVKKIWVEKFQGKLEEIKTIDLYFKPEENKVYFVINGLSNGDYFVEL